MTEKKFKEMYDGSWYTVIGMPQDEIDEVKEILKDALMKLGIGVPKKFNT